MGLFLLGCNLNVFIVILFYRGQAKFEVSSSNTGCWRYFLFSASESVGSVHSEVIILRQISYAGALSTTRSY